MLIPPSVLHSATSKLDEKTVTLDLIDRTPTKSSAEFVEWIRQFNRIGQPTHVYQEHGLRYFVNDYWTSRQRQGDRIHEISYRACFKPQLPEFFIDALTQPGDVVYDPFMGRGTTPIQAALMDRLPIGNDVNPLSAMLTRPRLNPPTLAEIHDRLYEIDLTTDCDIDVDLEVFYHPQTLSQLSALRQWLLDRCHSGRLDRVDDWIRMVAINRLTGHSPGFFSVYTLPPNQATSIERQRKINRRREQKPPYRDVREIILKKSKSLLKNEPRKCRHNPIIRDAPARDTPYIQDGIVDLIVTSPPFLDIVQYKSDNWLRCWFAGIDPDDIPISMHGTPQSWMNFVRDAFIEFSRVTKSGGYIAFEVGEVRNRTVLLERYVDKAIVGLPFELIGVIINQQKFTKTSNTWGIANNNRGTNTNRIVLIQRR